MSFAAAMRRGQKFVPMILSVPPTPFYLNCTQQFGNAKCFAQKWVSKKPRNSRETRMGESPPLTPRTPAAEDVMAPPGNRSSRTGGQGF